MKRVLELFTLFSLASAPLWAMPSQITFQGTLKQKGVPVNTTKNMQFAFVDATGASIPGTTPISVANVQVTNGLFAVQLPIDPSVPWEQFTPFIQVSVEGQILSPNQPLNENLYAAATFPQGFIGMFSTSCPPGWTRLAALDNAFPMGSSTYGQTGGSATHDHGGATGRTPGPGGTADSFSSGAYDFPLYGDTFPIASASNIPPYLTVLYCLKQ
jgi:hypothetical protein